MKSMILGALVTVASVAFVAPSGAAPLATTTSADGAYLGDIATLTDGSIPALGSPYILNTVHDFGNIAFTFDFGGVVTIVDVLASVDNNDYYRIDFYNGIPKVGSFEILPSAGSVGAGMDLFASFALAGATQIGGSLNLQATRAVIAAAAGDSYYGIGEVQFFGPTHAVPEPEIWAMMIGGFALAGGLLRRRGRIAIGV